jgi:hypothetical protein
VSTNATLYIHNSTFIPLLSSKKRKIAQTIFLFCVLYLILYANVAKHSPKISFMSVQERRVFLPKPKTTQQTDKEFLPRATKLWN